MASARASAHLVANEIAGLRGQIQGEFRERAFGLHGSDLRHRRPSVVARDRLRLLARSRSCRRARAQSQAPGSRPGTSAGWRRAKPLRSSITREISPPWSDCAARSMPSALLRKAVPIKRLSPSTSSAARRSAEAVDSAVEAARSAPFAAASPAICLPRSSAPRAASLTVPAASLTRRAVSSAGVDDAPLDTIGIVHGALLVVMESERNVMRAVPALVHRMRAAYALTASHCRGPSSPSCPH